MQNSCLSFATCVRKSFPVEHPRLDMLFHSGGLFSFLSTGFRKYGYVFPPSARPESNTPSLVLPFAITVTYGRINSTVLQRLSRSMCGKAEPFRLRCHVFGAAPHRTGAQPHDGEWPLRKVRDFPQLARPTGSESIALRLLKQVTDKQAAMTSVHGLLDYRRHSRFGRFHQET